MLYFGSRNFGQANFGRGLITTAVDESQTTSNMDAAGYILFDTSTFLNTATTNVDIAGGIQRNVTINISPTSTVITSGILMKWQAFGDLGVGTSTVSASGYIAWDSQLVSDGTWTTQIVD